MDKQIIIFDVESTGLIPFREVPGKRQGTTRKEQLSYATEYMQFPYICSIAWKVNDEPTKHYILNQEGREIPEEATKIHGITTEEANKSEHYFVTVISDFLRDCIGIDFVSGFNIYFDTSIIKANVLRKIKEKVFKDEIFEHITEILHKDKRIDVMREALKLFLGKWPKLTELYWKLFNEGFAAHSADADVEATRRCFLELVKRGIITLN